MTPISTFFLAMTLAYVAAYIVGCFLANDRIDKERVKRDGGMMLLLAVIARILGI